MRRQHFDCLQPVCPVCRSTTGQRHRLVIAIVAREEQQQVIEGVLHCSHSDCQREYPIIDGVPLIIGNIREYLAENVFQVGLRDELSPTIESMLEDCCGPGSAYDIMRQQLSSYAWDHYGCFDPDERSQQHQPGSIVRLLEHALKILSMPPDGPILDIGCAVGRTTFELAERYDQMVLGVDLNFAMLRLASSLLRTGTIRYPRRRVGLVYDDRQFSIAFPRSQQVDFWACDALALPFVEYTFATAVAMNLLDCVRSPVDFLASLVRILRHDAQLLLACPYDWAASATPLEAWLGGHSQRSPEAGDSELVLRRLLTPGDPYAVEGLRLLAETNAAWQVRLHERSFVSYTSHVVAADVRHE